MGGRRDLAEQHADRRARGAVPGGHQGEDRDHPDAHLHQQVRRQGPVGPVGLQEAPVEREQDEEGGRGQDGRNADAALLAEQHGHCVPAAEDDHRPHEDDQGALPVDAAGPAADEVARAVLVPERHPPHHRHHDGGAGHRQNEVEAGQLVEDPVAVRREEAGQGDGEDDAGAIGQDAGRGQRPGLQEPGPHRLDARARLGVDEEIGAERGPDGGGSEGHGGRDGLDQHLGRGGVRGLGVAHVWAFAASSSMPMRSTAGRIWRCRSSPPSTLTWMPSEERTSMPDTEAV